jgi:hypothetical protein
MADWMGNKGDRPTLEIWTGINVTRLARPVAAGSLSIHVYDPTGYAALDVVAIEAGLDQGEVRTVASVDATASTIVFTTALARAHPAGAEGMELAAPTTLPVTITAPDGTATTLALGDLTTVQAGRYTYSATEMTQEGDWTVGLACTGAVAAGGRDLVLSVLETGR